MRLQIGYVPLCDAAPVVMAQELGFAREEGLDLDLSAEPSWATLRDRLALGHLDGAHMLAPLALASALGLSGPPSDVVVGLPLSLNGNAITLSNALCEAMAGQGGEGLGEDWRGVARAFAQVAAGRRREGRPVTIGTVHPFSCHAYQVRLFAQAGGLDPAALRTVVVPPQHGVEALSRGLVDGFCAGAPWNEVALAAGVGRVAAFCAEIAPDAPEKVFAVSGRSGEATPALVRAVARAGLWCADPANRGELVHRLGRRSHLDRELGLVARAFERAGADETGLGRLRLGAPAQAAPPERFGWLLDQMRAAGQLGDDPETEAAARAVYGPGPPAAVGA
ncbi:CmpA/NrtA family ABC transporter substrate-binding protein [Methylobacterium sp. J-076]|uniref:CmpA/NrtA family ABC transporter substrate-binding protein n=1 Tax=Methylobacterium sp. J-076 TaxID=2836655 RepID=UPI001FBA0375|nr:CmpA/NrtA family ABC transporter substrate-binding protein [Methylobacterium sp. J-076]MCJ2013509.1 ABC transporter substrate-binding protein [Methylobacterium sp. J-076]